MAGRKTSAPNGSATTKRSKEQKKPTQQARKAPKTSATLAIERVISTLQHQLEKHVDYQTCIQQCISIVQAEGGDVTRAISDMRSFPIPSESEWADILRKEATAYGENDPFCCMTEYALRLEGRGVKTPMRQFLDLKQMAENAGMSAEEFLALFVLMGKPEMQAPTPSSTHIH
jgi:hypothetical protein